MKKYNYLYENAALEGIEIFYVSDFVAIHPLKQQQELELEDLKKIIDNIERNNYDTERVLQSLKQKENYKELMIKAIIKSFKEDFIISLFLSSLLTSILHSVTTRFDIFTLIKLMPFEVVLIYTLFWKSLFEENTKRFSGVKEKTTEELMNSLNELYTKRLELLKSIIKPTDNIRMYEKDIEILLNFRRLIEEFKEKYGRNINVFNVEELHQVYKAYTDMNSKNLTEEIFNTKLNYEVKDENDYTIRDTNGVLKRELIKK